MFLVHHLTIRPNWMSAFWSASIRRALCWKWTLSKKTFLFCEKKTCGLPSRIPWTNKNLVCANLVTLSVRSVYADRAVSAMYLRWERFTRIIQQISRDFLFKKIPLRISRIVQCEVGNWSTGHSTLEETFWCYLNQQHFQMYSLICFSFC